MRSRTLVRFVALVLLVGFVVSSPPPLSAATTDTFRDEFNNISYSGDDSTGGSWAGAWWDSEDQDPTTGGISVDSDASLDFILWFRSGGSGEYAERTADLSVYDSATLSFDCRRRNTDPSFSIKVLASANGPAGPFTEIFAIAQGDDPGYVGSGNLPITAYMSPTTTIRFFFEGETGPGKDFYLDNVEIAATTGNLPPVAVDDSDSTLVDTPVVIDVLANDSDPDLDPVSITGVTSGSNGGVSSTPTNVTYTPDPGWSGVDAFTYTIWDGTAFDTATVTVTVSVPNSDPVAVDDPDPAVDSVYYMVRKDLSRSLDVLFNDTDPDGDPLIVVSAGPGSNGGTTTVAGDGLSVSYSPPGSFYIGPDTFDYTISDGNGGTATGSVTVAVVDKLVDLTVNSVAANPPVPSQGSPFDLVTTIRNLGPDGAANAEVTLQLPLSLAYVSGSAENGTCAETPPASGTVVCSHGNPPGDSTPRVATVNVISSLPGPHTVTAAVDSEDIDLDPSNNAGQLTFGTVNVAPIAAADTAGTSEDTPAIIDVLSNDFDADLDPLVVDSVTQGGNGSVVNNGTDVTYTPNPDWYGIDTFTYAVTDGNGGFDLATVTVTVTSINDPPAAIDDGDSTLEDTAVTVDVLVNDSDPDLDVLTIDSVSQGANGSVVNNGSDVTYTPDPGWSGVDGFTYTVSDANGGFDTGTVTVTVSSTNIGPLAVDDADSTPEDTAITIDVLGNDTDADLDPLVVDSVTQGGNGSVTDNDSDVTYTPDEHWSGIDTFTYTISDGQGGTSSATVTVTVMSVNDDPLGVADSATTFEDTPVGVDALANDSDVDSSALTITAVTDGAKGTVTTDGLIVAYTPDPDWFGTDTFTYRVSDDLGGWCDTDVTVLVQSVNDDPVAVDDTSSTPRDTAVNIWVLDNDSDVDSDTLSVSAATNGANGTVVNHGIKVTYTPAPGWAGIDTFTYTVADGNGGFGSANVTVTAIAPANQVPVAKDDSVSTDEDIAVTVAPLANDSDPDGDAVTLSGVNQGAHGTVIKTATSFTYTPDKDWTGIDSFSYSITDGRGGTAAAAVVITVRPVNDPPVARDDSSTTREATSVAIAVLANDSDVDGDGLTVATITPGSRGVTITDGNTVTYSPSPGWSGSDSFGYTVTDGRGGVAQATVTITVTATKPEIDPAPVVPVAPKNHPPVITVIGDPAAEKGTRLRLEVTAEDPDGDGVSISATGLPGWLSLIDFGGGRASLTGVPWSGADPSNEIVISASDGTVTARVVVTIEVVDGNRPPFVRPISFSGVNDDGSFSFAISASDPDGDPLSISASGLPPWSNLTDHGDGTATISSDRVPNDAVGSFSVVVSVTDGQATVSSSLSRSIADLRLGLPPELTHQAFGTDGTDTLVATALKPRVATPDPLGAHLTPREGLMVAFGSAVETMKNQILPALVLGVVMAWMLMIGVGRTKEEEEPEPA